MAAFRTISGKLHRFSATDAAQLSRLSKRIGPRDQHTETSLNDAIHELRRNFSRDLDAVFPVEQREKIKESTSKVDGSRRASSLTEAKRMGIDLERVRDIQDRFKLEFSKLLAPRHHFSAADISVRPFVGTADWPLFILPADPDAGTIYVPPFGQSWEPTPVSNASGDGEVTENTSYLDATWGRIGSRLIAKNHDAGNDDYLNMHHRTGFIVPYTMPATGLVRISAELACLRCLHRVSTSDEWGWSDFHAVTHSSLIMSAFWEQDDGTPWSEEVEQKFVPGFDLSGDGESSPGTVVQVMANDRRSVSFQTDAAFPAGKTVWIRVGVADFVWAFLNDVSMDIAVDSAWQLTSLAVSTL